jgi:hypothetical protein
MQLPADVTLVAFDVLMHFVQVYEFLKRDSKVTKTGARHVLILLIK